jgi:AraC family transcriptional regulator
MTLYIKNMVCDRCVLVVKQELDKLSISSQSVSLGEVRLQNSLSNEELKILSEALSDAGFELLDDKKSKIVEKVKNVIIEQIHGAENVDMKLNLSALLKDRLHLEYNYISALFSETEGITIEQYFILQRIEKAKELLVYNEYTLSEIADKLGYSSVQYLSTQFKKVTGLTPTHFKTIKDHRRNPLDRVNR